MGRHLEHHLCAAALLCHAPPCGPALPLQQQQWHGQWGGCCSGACGRTGGRLWDTSGGGCLGDCGTGCSGSEVCVPSFPSTRISRSSVPNLLEALLHCLSVLLLRGAQHPCTPPRRGMVPRATTQGCGRSSYGPVPSGTWVVYGVQARQPLPGGPGLSVPPLASAIMAPGHAVPGPRAHPHRPHRCALGHLA